MDYYSRFMTSKEVAAMKHSITSQKFSKTTATNVTDSRSGFFAEKGWLSSDSEVLELIKDGIEAFRIKTATRIVKDNPGKVYFNNCPKCERLARTPNAKQCRYCGHSWHSQVVATFQIASAFQVTGRHFFIVGEILSGNIKTGMKADLTIIGLAKKPVITAMEYVLHRENGAAWEDIGLGFFDISEEDKLFLKSNSPFLTAISVEEQPSS
jgi:hypothetical protein